MAIIQIKKQVGNYTGFWYKEEINLKTINRKHEDQSKDAGVETEARTKPGLAEPEAASQHGQHGQPPHPSHTASSQPLEWQYWVQCAGTHTSGAIDELPGCFHSSWIGSIPAQAVCAQRNLASQCPHNPLALGVYGLGGRICITLQDEDKISLVLFFNIPSEGWLEIYRCLLLFWKCAIVVYFLYSWCCPMCKIQGLGCNYMSLIKQEVTSTMIWFKLCEPCRYFFLSLRHVWYLKISNIACILRYCQNIFVSLRARAGWGPRRHLASVKPCLLLLNIPFYLLGVRQVSEELLPAEPLSLLGLVTSFFLYCTWWQSLTGLLCFTPFCQKPFPTGQARGFPQEIHCWGQEQKPGTARGETGFLSQ